MSNKVDSREVGLIAGLNLFSFFIGTRDLHYGLWQDDLEVCVQNLPEAQRRYSEFLIGHIPDGVKRILDVGCGAGGLASELLARGYEVEGVSPSPLLSDAARRQAGALQPEAARWRSPRTRNGRDNDRHRSLEKGS